MLITVGLIIWNEWKINLPHSYAFLSWETLRHYMISIHYEVYITDGHQGYCSPECLEIIIKFLLCSSGFFPQFSHDQIHSMEGDLACGPRSRKINGHLVFLSFFNYHTNSWIILTKLLANDLVVHSSLVQGYNFDPDVLTRLFGFAHWGEVGIWYIGWFCGLPSFIQLTST